MTPSSRLLDLPSNRLNELFIKFWTLEDAIIAKIAAITIWRFIANDQSNRIPNISVSLAFASIFIQTIV